MSPPRLWYLKLAITFMPFSINNFRWPIHLVLQLLALIFGAIILWIRHYKFSFFERLNRLPLHSIIFLHRLSGTFQLPQRFAMNQRHRMTVLFSCGVSKLDFHLPPRSRSKSVLGVKGGYLCRLMLLVVIRVFCDNYHTCQIILLVIPIRL